MEQIGNRILYDNDGEIIFQYGEMEGDVLPRKEISTVNIVDIPYGYIDYRKQRLIKIDPVTKVPIIENIDIPLTIEEQRIIELENQLLLSSGVV